MDKLTPQEKLIEFLDAEFSKIEAEYSRQEASKRFKPKLLEKRVRKLLTDIELIMKTNSFNYDTTNKILSLKQKIENSFPK